MTNGAVFWSLVPLLIASCGGGELPGLVQLDPHARYAVQVVRNGISPAYRCDGTIETASSLADFACTAEQHDPWAVRGTVEHYELRDVVRLWIRDTGDPQKVQPDIAIDLQPVGDRFTGWGTIVFRDGTGSGHSGATVDAWRIDASAEAR
ncbi:MAG: hypothetical protein ACXWL8_01680 [Candidatus Limnocylindria bacterium]